MLVVVVVNLMVEVIVAVVLLAVVVTDSCEFGGGDGCGFFTKYLY